MGQPDLTYVLIDVNGTVALYIGLNRDLNSAFYCGFDSSFINIHKLLLDYQSDQLICNFSVSSIDLSIK